MSMKEFSSGKATLSFPITCWSAPFDLNGTANAGRTTVTPIKSKLWDFISPNYSQRVNMLLHWISTLIYRHYITEFLAFLDPITCCVWGQCGIQRAFSQVSRPPPRTRKTPRHISTWRCTFSTAFSCSYYFSTLGDKSTKFSKFSKNFSFNRTMRQAFSQDTDDSIPCLDTTLQNTDGYHISA